MLDASSGGGQPDLTAALCIPLPAEELVHELCVVEEDKDCHL